MQHIALVMRPDSGYYRGVLRGIKRYADEIRTWVFGMVAQSHDIPIMFKTFRPNGILAFIYLNESQEKLFSSDIPVVSFANINNQLTLPMVSVDDIAVGRMAAEYFLDRAFHSFAYVGFPKFNYSNQREEGFISRIREANATCKVFHDSHYPDAAGVWAWAAEPGICEWLKSLPRPTAILAANDAVGLRITEFARQMNIRIPEDLAVLGVDNDDLFCTLSYPQLSSIVTPMDQIGYTAAQMLHQMMNHVTLPQTTIMLPPVGVVTRSSSDMLAIEDQDLAGAIRFIHNNAHRPIGIKQVLSEISLSRRALERRCKQALGRTPLEELLRIRIQHVKYLLANTDKPMSVIAHDSGFTTNKQLSMTFHQQTGVTPTTYRRQMRLHHQ